MAAAYPAFGFTFDFDGAPDRLCLVCRRGIVHLRCGNLSRALSLLAGPRLRGDLGSCTPVSWASLPRRSSGSFGDVLQWAGPVDFYESLFDPGGSAGSLR